jgi:formate-dependent nitrite reductase membrane component NrfD
MTGNGATLRHAGGSDAGRTIDTPLIPSQLQTRWDVHHATWFTLMGVGGGVFLISRLLGLEMRLGLALGVPIVDIVSFVAIAVGGLILVADLGRPFRVLGALLRPRTSWISRGAIADFIFLVAGAALVLPGLRLGTATPFASLPWDAAANGAVGRTIEVFALVSSAIVIFYAGQVLADHSAIPYWRSPAVPIQFVLSSLAISTATVMVLEAVAREPIGGAELGLLGVSLVSLAVAVLVHLRRDVSAPGKRESLDLLLRGRLRRPFLVGVIAVGMVLPLALVLVALTAPSLRPAIAVVTLASTAAGGFYLRLFTLRAGFYAPVHAAVRFGRRV